MLSKNQIKFINLLKQKKHRIEHQLFVAEGGKIVSELINSSIVVKQVYSTPDFFQKNNLTISEQKSIECIDIKETELERISSLITPNEVLAICEIPSYKLNIDSLKGKLTLVLDDIKDPGNLGTIIRISDWFGIEQIICSNESVDVYNSKVVQATMGSISRIKVHYTDLIEFFTLNTIALKLPVYGALLDGKSIYIEQLSANGFVVIGNESRGINDALLSFITDKISIPSFSQYKSGGGGEAESLNAAIASSIICSEFRRRS